MYSLASILLADCPASIQPYNLLFASEESLQQADLFTGILNNKRCYGIVWWW